MPVYLGTNKIAKIYRGTVEITDSYLGTTKKYANAVPPIPTTRIGCYTADASYNDATWRSKALTDIGSDYDGRTARIVLVYRQDTAGTTYQGDIQIDRIRYGGITFDFDSAEDWRKEASVASNNLIGTYATRLASNNAIGTTVANSYWSRDVNATSSSGTGSAVSVYGGYCLYPETSGSVLGDYYWAKSPAFEYNSNALKDIIMAMEGTSCGIIAIYIVDEETTDFTPSLANPSEFFTVIPTTQPEITTSRCVTVDGNSDVWWRVKNWDLSSVTIWTEVSDSTPDRIEIASLGSLATSGEVTQGGFITSSVTIYAKATKSGEVNASDLSTYDSRVQSLSFCALA